MAWVMVAYLADIGIIHSLTSSSEDESDSDNTSGMVAVVGFVLLVALYWGANVIKNIGHVTTAGVVASWWYEPSRSNIVSSALCRSCTTSLGSIAFGSLIVAVIQALEAMVKKSRQGGESNIFSCIAACILACLR